MTEPQPDIEIYLKRPAIEDILGWLDRYFEITGHQTSGDKHELGLSYKGAELTCLIFEKVAKGGYASIWFKSNQTPWSTDEVCASDAFACLGLETRCSSGGWEPGEEGNGTGDDTGGWYRFTAAGKTRVNWLT